MSNLPMPNKQKKLINIGAQKKLYKTNVANGITKYAQISILTMLADTKRTTMTNTCCCVYSVEILLMTDSGPV
jgi:hypothetical protein